MGVADYYDDYVTNQASVGINDRHRRILRLLRRFGLRPDHGVLEIGCGIGTLTELLAEYLTPAGQVFATDISARSIAAATRRLRDFHNVELVAGDVLQIAVPGPFDVVVLPDVIEHIPLDLHPALFGRVASWVKPDGFVLLHYPNPYYLQWVSEHRPHLLQVIDQPIHANVLTANVYAAGLSLDYYERYSIWCPEGDYVIAVLRPESGIGEFSELSDRSAPLAIRIALRLLRAARRAYKVRLGRRASHANAQ